MAKPQTREELLVTARELHDQVLDLVDSLPNQGRTGEFSFAGRERNVRDVFIHLAAWQKMYLDWSQANLGDKPTSFLPKPFTWKKLPALNHAIWQKNQHTSYDNARKAFETQHVQIIRQIEGFINEQLFTDKFYAWTGSTSLGSYANAATVDRYAWAVHELRRYKKQLQPAVSHS